MRKAARRFSSQASESVQRKFAREPFCWTSGLSSLRLIAMRRFYDSISGSSRVNDESLTGPRSAAALDGRRAARGHAAAGLRGRFAGVISDKQARIGQKVIEN